MRTLGLTGLLLVGLSCGGGEDDVVEPDLPDTSAPQGLALQDVTGEVNEIIPTVYEVSFGSSEGARSWVEFGQDGQLDRSTPILEDTQTHGHTLLGLKAGGTYTWRAVLESADGVRVEGETQEVSIDLPPSDMPRINVTTWNPELSQLDGHYLLFSVMEAFQSWVVILDIDGDYVWYYEVPPELNVVTSAPGRDGKSLIWAMYDRDQLTDVGNVTRLSLDGRTETVTRTLLGHHDFVEHEDGTLGWLAFIDRDVQIVFDSFHIYTDRIYEAPEGSGDDAEPVEIFNFFDDYDVDPWWVCSHVSEDEFGGYGYEWTHSNSLVYSEADAAYYVQSRFLDAMLKVDRATGEVLWQMGGAHSDFGGIPEADWWSHGHLSQVWEDGLMVFNNCNHCDDPVSRVAEYAYDEEAKTIEKVWEYVDPGGRFVEILGDVRKLPGGNYVASWTSGGLDHRDHTRQGDRVED